MTSSVHLKDIEAKYLKIVSEFAIDMLSLNGVDNILWHLARNVVSQLGFDDVVIYLVDEQRQCLIQTASFGAKNPKDKEILSPIELKIGEGVVGQVAKSGIPIIISDTRLSPHYVVDDAPRLSELAVPMIVEGEVIGVIDTEHPKKNFYNEQHQQTLYALATITALKIHKARTLLQLQTTIEELEYSSKIQDTLFEIAEIIFETDSIHDFYARLHQCISRLTFAKNFYVAILSKEGTSLSFPYHIDEFDHVEQDTEIYIDAASPSITGHVLLKNKPLLLNQLQLAHMVAAGEIHINGTVPKAWLGVPFGDEHFRGIVVVQNYSDSYAFQLKDKQLLMFVAKHIRNAIERMNVKSRMEFLALHDPLTALPNRILFSDRFNRSLKTLASNSGKGIAILYIDLDRFKGVNDTYGHHLGDELLKAVAARLKLVLRPQDTLCRLSGDEFAVLLEDISSANESETIATQLLQAMSRQQDLGGIRLKVTGSIGIVNCFDADATPAQLLIYADEAMYKAKLLGRNRCYSYHGDGDSLLSTTYKFETDFTQGLAEGQLFLEYQPLYHLKNDEILGAEALIRWRHPSHGMIAPIRFLPELQKAGLLDKLDLFVVEQAMSFLASQQANLPPAFKLSVNVSGAGLNSIALMALFDRYFRFQPVLLAMLSVEITEQTIVSSVEETRSTIERLHGMGVTISLDDFGTGYSSLSYLHQFTFDLLKIDRSFISHMDLTYDNQIILETIINLAKSLNIKTVAEGIETKEQYRHMQALACDYGQGYYMNRSLVAADFMNELKHSPIFVH
ncbi:EAL domain-containing protein [Shewanella colwelliana]|uniref:EAL domain-containing protein n=1 Tax=Shewanella colwelliana TaxID=23 RepID=UPI003735D8EE